MTTPKRRYIDELMDGIRFSSGGPVSISLETAKRLVDLFQPVESMFGGLDHMDANEALHNLNEEMPEPKP